MFSVKVYLYTGYYARLFKKFGDRSIIKPSCRMCCGLSNISIGSDVTIGRDIELTALTNFKGQIFHSSIFIDDKANIHDNVHITAIDKIYIGKNVLIAPNVLITDNAHGASEAEYLDLAPNLRPVVSKGPVIIEDNVWIGEKASIMPGVRIGKGAIIGANSVVTHDVPPYCVAAGIPAKVVKVMK